MKPSEEEALLARLAAIAAAPKSFDAKPIWAVIPDRASARLCCTVALRMDGVLGRHVRHDQNPEGGLGRGSVRSHSGAPAKYPSSPAFATCRMAALGSPF
jgi:hypothetical protein